MTNDNVRLIVSLPIVFSVSFRIDGLRSGDFYSGRRKTAGSAVPLSSGRWNIHFGIRSFPFHERERSTVLFLIHVRDHLCALHTFSNKVSHEELTFLLPRSPTARGTILRFLLRFA